MKILIRSYFLVTDGDETEVTAATDPDDLICADGIDVGTVSNSAVHAVDSIKNLQRVPDWKGQTAELYKKVSVRFKRKIFTTHTHPRRLEIEIVETDRVIRRTRSA